MNEDEPLQALWSIYEKSTASPVGRKLKSGKFSYRKPVENPNSSSQKLIPAIVSKQTQHDRQKRQINTIGKNNNMMSNWLVNKNKDNETPQPTEYHQDRDQGETGVEPVTSTVSNPDPNYNTVIIRLEQQMDLYLSAPKYLVPQDLNKIYAEADSLNCRKLLSEHLVSAVLRQEYRLNGTPKAPLAASLALPAATGGNRSNHVTLIDNSNIRKALFTWTVSQIPGEVTPATFLTHVNEVVLPAYNISKTIVRSTATRWMAKLGFRPQEYKKSLYSDDHGRPDVVIARKKYIEDYQMYQSRSHLFGANLNLLAQVEPEVLGKNQETVYIFHDKSTVHAKERPRLAWLLPGANQIRSKNAGQLIHISNFILETTGRLKLSSEDFEKSQEESGKKPESADAATVICPSTKDDKWWDLEQLCHQVAHKAIPIFETIHPTLQAVFVFDCSSAHGADAMSATWHM
ncbi:hypothetical protein PSTT_05751 [Puccinia striiformis]|uniref:DDE-1 domain-containing protein n=1 Tax=Puccinia striiformis TaxID=27350 RepID=A0A2S4VMQ8_9BASI|nr:hypothetical protein PSTT_05751 [Puccinia striiformis]